MRGPQQDPVGLMRGLAAMVLVLGLLFAIALWAGAPWVAMSLWEMPLPGIICIPIVLFGGVVLGHWLGKEGSDEAVGTPPEASPGDQVPRRL